MAELDKTGGTSIDAIESTIYRILYNEVSTFLPAIITAVNRKGDYILLDVESCFLKLNDDVSPMQTYTEKILDVPLMIYQNGGMVFRPPLDDEFLIGESVGLIVANTYLANWKKTGGKVLPTQGRKFHIADAVAQLGLYPSNKTWKTKQVEKTAELQVKSGVKLSIGNEDGIDLMTTVADIVDILKNAVSISGGGALTFLPSTITQRPIDKVISDFKELYNKPSV